MARSGEPHSKSFVVKTGWPSRGTVACFDQTATGPKTPIGGAVRTGSMRSIGTEENAGTAR